MSLHRGARAVYDAVACAYDAQLGDELDAKPLDRALLQAFVELRLLVGFHVDSPEFATGQVNHLTTWFGENVELDGYFLDPVAIAEQIEAAGFTLMSRTDRVPIPDVEYPSRRCYLLGQRR